jgi:hypothetical protein
MADQPPTDSGSTTQNNPTVEGITAVEVLGMMARLHQRSGHPPALLCMSVEAREEIRRLGEKQVAMYREAETELLRAREAGNPRAFFVEV